MPGTVRPQQRRRHRSAGDADGEEKAAHEKRIDQDRAQQATHHHAQRQAGAVRTAAGRGRQLVLSAPVSSTARNAFCGMSTLPIDFIRFLPSFCLAHSLRFREMSPP